MNNVRIYFPGQPGYGALQGAVTGHYERCYGAHPEPAPDQFWCLTGQWAQAPGHACLGLSWGAKKKLFSEYYLDRPFARSSQTRSRLVEIGQVASFSGHGSGAYLLSCVLRFLSTERDGHAILTGTRKIRELLEQLDVGFVDLGPARVERVHDRSVDWGTYYQQQPRVIVIDLRSGLRSILQPAWEEPLATPFNARMLASNPT